MRSCGAMRRCGRDSPSTPENPCRSSSSPPRSGCRSWTSVRWPTPERERRARRTMKTKPDIPSISPWPSVPRQSAPIWREEAHILLLTMHHIVSDGMVNIGVSDTRAHGSLRGFRADKPSPLPESARSSTPTMPPGSANGCKGRCWSASSPTGRSIWPGRRLLELPTDRPARRADLPRGRQGRVRFSAELTARSEGAWVSGKARRCS